jgi:hypothetical protein
MLLMDLETLLSSSCRRRILRVLARNGRLNVMEIVRKINSTYNQVNSSLHILKKECIVFDAHFGRLRLVRLNRENPRTALLLQALKMLETCRVRVIYSFDFAAFAEYFFLIF